MRIFFRSIQLMHKLALSSIAAFVLSVGISLPLYSDDDGHGGKNLGIKIETLAKSSKEWSGEILPSYPESQPEITVLRIIVPAGVKLPLHTHPVINTAVVIQGTLELRHQDNKKRIFNTGDALIEVVNKIHTGKSIGPDDLIVIVFYAGSENLPTTVLAN